MKYFIFKKEEIDKGDKVKIIVRKFDRNKGEFNEEVLDEFILENFEYYPQVNLYSLISTKNFTEDELKEKVGDGEIIAIIEKPDEQKETF